MTSDKDKAIQDNYIKGDSLLDDICATKTQLFSVMKPFLLLMKACGLYHYTAFDSDTSHCMTDQETGIVLKQAYKRTRISVSMIYSAAICTMLAINALRCLSTFSMNEEFDLSIFLWKIGIVSWLSNCTTNAIACFRAANKYNGLTNFFLEYDRYPTKPVSESCKMHVMVHLVVCCILIVANTALSLFIIFYTSAFDPLLSPFKSTHPNGLYIKLAVSVTMFYLNCALVLPMFLMIIICTILVDLFSSFNKCLQATIMCKAYTLPINFEKMRQMHLTLCRLVTYADNFLSLYCGVTLLVACVHITVNLYNLIWTSDSHKDTSVLFGTIFWTIVACIQIILVCFAGALVNSKAHEPLDYFFEISADIIPSEKQIHVQLFLAKLNGPPIGLSVLGMFVIDKPVILTILGLLLSYFVIIVQFSPAFIGGEDISNCNCTEILLNATLHCYS